MDLGNQHFPFPLTNSFQKRFMIEELRFYDEHGRQGKRHPVKNTLS